MKCHLILLLLFSLLDKIYGLDSYISQPKIEFVDYDNNTSVTILSGLTEHGKIDNKTFTTSANHGNIEAVFVKDGSFSCAFNQTNLALCSFGLYLENIDEKYKKAESFRNIEPIVAKFQLDNKYIENEERDDYYFNVGVTGWSYLGGILYNFSIVDNWNIIDSRSIQKIGDYVVDGAEYTIYNNYKDHYYNYISYRKEPRNDGTIDVTAHFKEWEELGINIYSIKEVNVYMEIESFENADPVTGSSKFLLSDVYFDERDSKCSEKIQDYGFECCSNDCEVIYTDNYGPWGFENEEWCGCGKVSTTTTTATTTSTNSSSETNSVTVKNSKNGTLGDKYYQLFIENGGENFATFNDDGTFTCTFKNSYDGFCQYGYYFKDEITVNETVSVDYSYETPIYHNVGYTDTGIYGKAQLENKSNEYVEYYIIEDQEKFTSKESNRIGNYTVDGAVYSFYVEKNRYFFIDGSVFRKIYGVRNIPRNSGTIDVIAHVQQWKEFGYRVGKFVNMFLYTDNYYMGKRKTIYAVYNFTKFNINIGKKEEPSKDLCSPIIIKQGYKCCSPNCKTVYVDKDGNWGVENNQWCGCMNEVPKKKGDCSKKITDLGFDCCPKNCKVIYKDEDGDWGVHNGQWCGCN